MFPTNGFTHCFKAKLGMLVIVTNHLNGFPLGAYFVFEIPGNGEIADNLLPHGPVKEQLLAVAYAKQVVQEIADLEESITPEQPLRHPF